MYLGVGPGEYGVRPDHSTFDIIRGFAAKMRQVTTAMYWFLQFPTEDKANCQHAVRMFAPLRSHHALHVCRVGCGCNAASQGV